MSVSSPKLKLRTRKRRLYSRDKTNGNRKGTGNSKSISRKRSNLRKISKSRKEECIRISDLEKLRKDLYEILSEISIHNRKAKHILASLDKLFQL